MAFGDLVKSLIVRFSVENFEPTKLAMDDIATRAEVLRREIDLKATFDDGDLWAKLELLRIEFKSARDAGVKDFTEIALAVHAIGDEAEGTALKLAALQLGAKISSAGEGAGAGGGILSMLGMTGGNALALGLGAALVPVVTELASILPALAAAGQGVVAFGALGYPTFTKIYDAVTGVAGAMNGLDAPQRKIVTNIQDLEHEFSKLAAAFAPALTPLLQTLTGKGGILSQILQDLPPFANAAAKAIGPLLTQFDKFLASPGAQAFQNLMLKLEGPAITAIGQGLGKLGVAVGKFLEDLANPSSIRILNDTFTALALLIEGIGWAVKQVNLRVSEWITDWERLYHDTKQWADDTWQAVSHAFDNVMHAFDNVQHAGDVFSSDLANVFKRVVSDVENWYHDVVNWLDKAVAWFQSLGGKIMGALSNLGSMLYSAGAHAIQSLISGLGSGLGGLTSMALHMASIVAGHFGLSPARWGPLSGSGAPEIRGAHLVDAIGAGMTSRLGALAAASHGVAAAAGIGMAGVAGSGAGVQRIQLEWVGGGSEQEIFTYLKRHIRARGGNPSILGA